MQETKKHRTDAPHQADAKTQAIIDHLINTLPSSYFDWRPMQYLTAVLFGLICLPIGMLIQYRCFGSSSVARVDGIALTEDEMDFVRGSRIANAELSAAQSANVAKNAAYMHELMEELGDDQGDRIAMGAND